MNVLTNLTLHNKIFLYKFLSLLTFFIIISSCAPSKRFTEYKESKIKDYVNEVRILLEDSDRELKIDTDVYLISENERLALIKAGNKILVEPINQILFIKLGTKNFNSKVYYLESVNDSLIKVNDKKYRGRIKLINIDKELKMINQLSLEDYIKGVMTKEMPVGKGSENYEALKAFAIAARTYALNKIFKSTTYYDLLPDVRDQVYGGADAEHPLSNMAVDETRDLILLYNGKPAIVFYHSTCAGFTENSANVFTNDDIEYLRSIRDGDTPFCSVSPNFNWKEVLPEKTFIKRLYDAKLIKSSDYLIEKFNIKSRFPSGRINELEVTLKNGEGLSTISIFGNQIRSIIKNQSGNGILKSNNFIIELTPERNVEIIGKGYGHGVGLCQWGAIGQSRLGKSYKEILSHYFPGTDIKKLND